MAKRSQFQNGWDEVDCLSVTPMWLFLFVSHIHIWAQANCPPKNKSASSQTPPLVSRRKLHHLIDVKFFGIHLPAACLIKCRMTSFDVITQMQNTHRKRPPSFWPNLLRLFSPESLTGSLSNALWSLSCGVWNCWFCVLRILSKFQANFCRSCKYNCYL